MANRQRRVPVGAGDVRDLVRTVFREENGGDPWVSVALVNDRVIAEVNRRWLGHEGPTDSIAFEYGDDPSPDGTRGEVIVSAETALREAQARGLDPRGELLLYVAHGLLHLLGWEDDTPARRRSMNARARRLVALATHRPPTRRRVSRR
ncbi:MAG: rRNA maturation RNase YbeY [Planctomycetota bacterium]